MANYNCRLCLFFFVLVELGEGLPLGGEMKCLAYSGAAGSGGTTDLGVAFEPHAGAAWSRETHHTDTQNEPVSLLCRTSFYSVLFFNHVMSLPGARLHGRVSIWGQSERTLCQAVEHLWNASDRWDRKKGFQPSAWWLHLGPRFKLRSNKTE